MIILLVAIRVFFVVIRFTAFLLVFVVSGAFANAKTKWYEFKTPSTSEPQVYGSYMAGCFSGGVPIKEHGVGYLAVAKHRGRLYGHPNLVNYVEDLGGRVFNKHQITLYISDLSQPRGGPPPASSAHKSHQSGLDVDIWYNFGHPSKSEATKPVAYSVLTTNRKKLSASRWRKEHMYIIKEAALDDKVERIFVTPHVKKEICRYYKKSSWLYKVRPWWGHHRHFHVRLKCPKGAAYCEAQNPVPKDSSCDETLDWWFSDDAARVAREAASKKKEVKDVILPEQCNVVAIEG